MKNLFSLMGILFSLSLWGQTPATVISVNAQKDTISGLGVVELFLCEIGFATGTKMQVLVPAESKVKANEQVYFFEEPRRIVVKGKTWYCYLGNMFSPKE